MLYAPDFPDSRERLGDGGPGVEAGRPIDSPNLTGQGAGEAKDLESGRAIGDGGGAPLSTAETGAGWTFSGLRAGLKTIAARVARVVRPTPVTARFGALERESDPDDGPGATARPAIFRGLGGKSARRVVAELINWYKTRQGDLPEEPPEYAHQAKTAQDFKTLIYKYCDPQGGGDISVPCPKVPFRTFSRDAFWDQIALSRLRFQGSKGTYAVCRAAGQRRSRHKDGERGRRVLVLHVPEPSCGRAMGGGGDDPGGYDERHAARQATFNDNADGVFERGRRVHLRALAEAGVPEDEMERLRKGYALVLKWWPKQYHGKHYGGALEHPEKLQSEHERMLARGFVEGPLMYVPWIVQSLGGVWKMDKEKWRTIVDATSSGVNPACVPLECQYDMLSDAVKGMRPGCRLSSFDLTDAFLNWPYDQTCSDLMGYRDTKGEYFRYRFLGFGGAQSPAVQQRWAARLKDILNRTGLKYCTGRAADYSTFECVMAYMDDFCCVHTGVCDADDAEQYASVLRVLAELGLEDKASKRQPPSLRLEILGFLVDTVGQTVTVTRARCERLLSEIDAFLADSGADVGRRDLASLVGQLQWVAQIAQGGQLHLRQCYRARDDFVTEVGPSMREQWGRGVRVRRTAGLRSDLVWWRSELPRLEGKKMYLTNLAVANGFWRGTIDETDEQLDAADGLSGEDVVVYTTDASGYAGGAWVYLKRAAWMFDEELRAPKKSSNYRELLTAVLALERWGPEHAGRRILIRTDNMTTASVLNKGDTRWATLEGLAHRLAAVVKKYDLDVSGRHIPGLKNGLADALSRRRFKADAGDWQFDPHEFRRAAGWLLARRGRGFDVDACADPTGQNAHCERFWSAVDSCLAHSMAGMHVWCNADWELLWDVLGHFRAGASERPFDTAGVFVIPEKTRAPWWRKLKGFRVLARYPAGTQLFTRPVGVLTGQREVVRPAKWPVLLVWWEPASREPARAGADGVSPGAGAGRLGADRLLRLQLSGDGALDAERLHHL